MTADTRIEADTVDDLLCVQTLALCIGVQLVEVSNTKSQIGISEQFDSLGLGEAHEQSVDVLFNCTFLQQTSELVCCLYQSLIT